MKYYIILFVILFLITGCTETEKPEMILTGNVKGLKKGTLYLQKQEDSLFVTIDSLRIDGVSDFRFVREIESPERYFLMLKLEHGSVRDDRIAFFAEPAEINIRTTLKNFGNEAQITGSENQLKMEAYQKLMQRYNDAYLESIQNLFVAGKEQNDSLLNALQQKQDQIIRNKYLATINFALNNKDYELAPYLLVEEVPDVQLKYMDTVYGVLPPKIKDSNYGMQLESLIASRKERTE